jgi:hypothetical protein
LSFVRYVRISVSNPDDKMFVDAVVGVALPEPAVLSLVVIAPSLLLARSPRKRQR